MTFNRLKRWIIGRPIRSEQAGRERLSNFSALAVLASDALSSVAYATEEILIVLVAGVGILAWHYSLIIAAAVTLLIVLVVISYRQTISNYPHGGGAYSVAKENLGVQWGLLAAASLLIDYVLTISVSVTAGIAAITSAIPFLFEHRVFLGVLTVIIITTLNLRGVRDTGKIFILPTFAFIASITLLVTAGFIKLFLHAIPIEEPAVYGGAVSGFGIFLLLRAFASGSTAMTGIEAISNGVPIFREPTSTNARKTLAWLGAILIFLFFGVTYLAAILHVAPLAHETVVSQLGRKVFGQNIFYYLIQAVTAFILFLASNTSFSDFPRLLSLLARDGYVARQFKNVGDRLVFSNGILFLAILSSLLIVFFNGSTHALIGLYALGVFLSFTLSQWGMASRWRRLKEKNWFWHYLVNASGAVATAVVVAIVLITKFMLGAWIVIVLMVIMLFHFHTVRRHYRKIADSLRLNAKESSGSVVRHTAIILVSGLNRATLPAIRYAQSLSQEVVALHISIDKAETERLEADWKKFNIDIPLEVVTSPQRSIVAPLFLYIDKIDRKYDDDIVSVILPEFVPRHFWENFLHNQRGWLIKFALWLRRRDIVVIDVPYHLPK